MSRAVVVASREVASAIRDVGVGLGGFFSLPSAEPAIVDLEDVISEQYFEAAKAGEPIGELVLESEL